MMSEIRMRRRAPALAGMCVLMVVAAGCGDKRATAGDGAAAGTGGAPTTSGQIRDGGTVNVAIDLIDHMDPALWYGTTTWTIANITCTTLLTYPDAPGDAGKKLGPGLAEMPTVSDGGRTYTFTFRHGVKFSDGRPITPADMKYTLERALAPAIKGPAPGFWGDLQGAQPVIEGKAMQASGLVATGDKLIVKLTKPSGSLLQRVSMKWLCPVPKGTPRKPIEDGSLERDAASGPYELKSYTPDREMVLVRNPQYPAGVLGARGHVDEFDMPINVKSTALIEKVKAAEIDADIGGLEAGDANAALDDPTLKGRVFRNPGAGIRFFFLNNDVPPFDNVKVRMAINYAINRNQVAKVAGGAGVASPTDQILPPTMAGWKDYDAFPLGGDIAKGKQLMAESGVKTPVSVKINVRDDNVQVAQVVQADLQKIGIDLKFRIGTSDVFDPQEDQRKNRVPGGLVGTWDQDYPDPENFFTPLLDPRLADLPTRKSRFDDKAMIPDFVRAENTFDPAARAVAYQALDQKVMTKYAPWVPLYNPTIVNIVSDGVTGYVFHPVYNRINLATLALKR